MNTRRVSAVILAGGRSIRFGRDKLAEPLDGRPMLDHAIDAVRPFATEILVVAAPDSDPPLPDGARLIHDPVAFEGPLAGALAGLGAARGSIVLVLEHDGRARPLPLVLRREPALATAQRLFTTGERRLRALPEALATSTIPEATWRALDPAGLTLRDIDTVEDRPAR